MQKKTACYLRPNRRRWGLTQSELALLLGVHSGSAISRIELGESAPTLEVALGCQILFGLTPMELFPGAFSSIEEQVIARGYELYENLQGDASTANHFKLNFFEQAFSRATARLKNAEV